MIGQSEPMGPDLALVNEAWKDLPKPIEACIAELVNAARGR
jgi:hypothetical protein